MRLVQLSDLEPVKDWYVTNPFVKGGYRPPHTGIFASLFQWHNETLSIYTHFLPGLYWLYWVFAFPYDTQTSLTTRCLIGYVYASAAFMGLSSGFAHIAHTMDSSWALFCWKMDYLGIVAVNLGHELMDCYLLFHSYPTLLGAVYIIKILFAAYCCREILKGSGTSVWGLVYPLIGMATFTLPIALHPSLVVQRFAPYSLGTTLFVCIAATLFYVGKLPERIWNPNGIFDMFNSHVWHHLFIVASIVCGSQVLPELHRIAEPLTISRRG